MDEEQEVESRGLGFPALQLLIVLAAALIAARNFKCEFRQEHNK